MNFSLQGTFVIQVVTFGHDVSIHGSNSALPAPAMRQVSARAQSLVERPDPAASSRAGKSRHGAHQRSSSHEALASDSNGYRFYRPCEFRSQSSHSMPVSSSKVHRAPKSVGLRCIRVPLQSRSAVEFGKAAPRPLNGWRDLATLASAPRLVGRYAAQKFLVERPARRSEVALAVGNHGKTDGAKA